MTKKHFIRAAEIVRAIRDGHWTNEPPTWSNVTDILGYPYEIGSLTYCDSGSIKPEHVRAVQTAEAFIALATEFNPRFDTQRFLVACGLVDAPVKAKGKR